MLRILHTEASLGWGGQEIRILTEARGLQDRGHRVALACPREARIHDEAIKRGIDTVALPIGRKRAAGLIALRAWLREHGESFDVINTHSSTDAWLAVLACAGLANPPALVRTRHLSTDVDRSPLTRWLYVGGTRTVVTTGERIRQRLFVDNGYPLARMVSVPTGIDLSRYAPGDRHAARASLALPDRPTLGIVATLRGWKGHADLLDAWRTLAARFPDWQVVIVGDGPQRENLAARIAQEGIADRVRMVGNRDDVETWLQAFDLFALPSWGNEGVPQAVLQAMASGLAVVSTTVGSIDEAVVDGETGFLVGPRDVPALASRLAQLMQDGALRAQFGAAGRDRALARFGLDAMLDRMQAVFRAAVARAPVASRLPGEARLHVAFPYNEILPKRSAHDVYVFTTAVAAAQAGAQSSLLAGKGGWDEAKLHAHYRTEPSTTFHAFGLPIVRRNVALRLSVNAVFDQFALRWLRRARPDWVVTSVIKQGLFHAANPVAGMRHAHEVHELAWYPGRDANAASVAPRLARERRLLAAVDLVIVTTEALAGVLRAAPYGITTPIRVLPLAAPRCPALPPVERAAASPIRLAYVGQLYREQGMSLLLRALALAPGLWLDVVGGRADELALLEAEAEALGIADRVTWHGFVSPGDIAPRIAATDAFVAPFLCEGRMPFVAHTKLAEYRAWRRPVVAPDLAVTREHLVGAGFVAFEAGDAASLGAALRALTEPATLARLQAEAAAAPERPDSVARARAYLDIFEALGR